MRHAKFYLAASILLLATACSRPLSPDIWVGTTANGNTGVVQDLRLEVQNRSGRIVGSYFVEAARGTIDGTVDTDGSLTAVLTPAETCTFELTGTIVGDNLTGVFAPLDCPGGTGGSWALERQ